MNRLTSPSGLSAEINSNGSLRRFDHGAVSILLFVGNELDGGLTNLFLRRLGSTTVSTPLLGPLSPTRFEFDANGRGFVGYGAWQGIEYSLALVLAQATSAWFWHVQLSNVTDTAMLLDLTYAQDLALAPYGAIRMNEFYVSQYIDHTPLEHPTNGIVIASRQNQAADGKYPWCIIGSLRKASSFATDALQFYGLSARSSQTPDGLLGDLPGTRLQHEHSMAVLRDERFELAPRQTIATGFFGHSLSDHPSATQSADLSLVAATLELPEASPAQWGEQAPRAPTDALLPSLFSAHAPLEALDLDQDSLQALFGSQRRHAETDEEGRCLSFFCDENRHVVLRAKELRVLRPHGHLLRTGLHLTPDEQALTSTVWMNGVFHSMVTQGHVSINRYLSTVHSYLDLFRSHGLRMFVEIDQRWRLLALPSAFEMTPQTCRWIYRHSGGTIEVRAAAENAPHQLTLTVDIKEGPAARLLLSQHIALNGDDGSAPGPALWHREGASILVNARHDTDVGRRFPEGSFRLTAADGTSLQQVGGDELLFVDGRSRQQPFVCIVTAPTRRAAVSITADLIRDRVAPLAVGHANDLAPVLGLSPRTSGALANQATQLAEIVPWFAHNGLVHYLSPRGLEQYSGGGWGTRDVCQGPVELLLALGRVEPMRDLLLRVISQQNADGDWPQWFMFFDRERGIRPGDSHGDIVFWPLLVLGQYLLASGDASILDERVRYFASSGSDAGASATVWEHAQRALALIERRVIPGTALAAYGHGDWNDSLQPADPALRDHLCSAWTVTLNHQMLTTLARALRAIGRPLEADAFDRRAAQILGDFQRLLVVDGVLTGYALFNADKTVRYLLHPRDEVTGVHYSSLAMIHAILEDLLSPEQIREHLQLIEERLHASDGIRLFDCPMHYHGGPQQIFQRAETATFFGREIGLMYMHAHLRYAQALAHLGEASRFFKALCQANPIGIRAVVPNALLRQSNCYYSSSDAKFADRYQASAEYGRVSDGTIDLEGGWRVYSSGAGIALGLIVRHFLGLRRESDALVVDPVIPPALDGLIARTTLFGKPLDIEYQIGTNGSGVTNLALNGVTLTFVGEANPHRLGGARVPLSTLTAALRDEQNRMTVSIS